ncbi:formyltransferase family protein [Pseudoalteromonas fenneropenaei]|uniref:Formyltransferase family protein n=1 Tax=Pseudoalteromonas fenneropenaei TaxID=1737459 RepID=A0ABV7CKD9_9GAMM
MNKKRVCVNLLGKKGYDCLKSLVNSNLHDCLSILVVIGQDDNVTNDYSAEVEGLCNNFDIDFVYRDKTLDYSLFDYVFAVGWRWLIRGVLEQKLIVFHDSILPKYRGFAPLVNAAMNKEPQLGVTALYGHTEYDKGDIIGQRIINVTYPNRISHFIDVISNCYAVLFIDIVEQILDEKPICSIVQNEAEASYSIWLDDEDYYINWADSAEDIAHKINLLGAPYKHACTFLKEDRINLISAEVYKDLTVEARHIGKVMLIDDGCPVIICGDGLIKLTDFTDSKGNSLIPYTSIRARFKNDSI